MHSVENSKQAPISNIVTEIKHLQNLDVIKMYILFVIIMTMSISERK